MPSQGTVWLLPAVPNLPRTCNQSAREPSQNPDPKQSLFRTAQWLPDSRVPEISLRPSNNSDTPRGYQSSRWLNSRAAAQLRQDETPAWRIADRPGGGFEQVDRPLNAQQPATDHRGHHEVGHQCGSVHRGARNYP